MGVCSWQTGMAVGTGGSHKEVWVLVTRLSVTFFPCLPLLTAWEANFHTSELLAHRFLTGITPQNYSTVREEDGSRKGSCLIFPNPWHLWRHPFFVCSLRGRDGSQLVAGLPPPLIPSLPFTLPTISFTEPGLWYPNCTLPGPDWKEIVVGVASYPC